MKPIQIDSEEFISLHIRNGQPFIRWIRSGELIVDRPAYGAEEKLIRLVELLTQ